MAEFQAFIRDESDDSDNEREPFDDDDDDEEEEVLGDDENLSDYEDSIDDDDPNDANRDVVVNDNPNLENPIEVNDVLEGEVREVPQQAMFEGVDTVGMRVPLQYMQNITAVDHLLVFLAQLVRHNDTYERLMNNLIWIKKSFRRMNIPTTKQALWNVLGRKADNVTYRFFCSQCKQEIGEGAITIRCNCGRCGPGKNESFVSVFIQLLLRPQIIDFLSIPNIAEALRYKYNRVKLEEDAIEDIYDGEMYKEASEPGEFLDNPYNFSFTLWTDGLKLTKSSRATTYPVVLQLNELSPHARKKHLFLTGLWVSNEHPVMNTILRPTVDEIRDLHRNGINWRPDGVHEVTSRFIISTFTADSPAKSDSLRMMRFNGGNGCPACMAPGETVNNKRVYEAQEYEMREDGLIRRDGLLAIATRRAVNGVKGVSSLAGLPEFDLVKSVVVDPAHNPFLGVAKRLMERFLTDVGEEWYIGDPNMKELIDERLLTITPPNRISRSPRSVNTYRLWKASEWRNWLIYYSLPCLEGILPQHYFDHLSLLSSAIYILNSASISQDQLIFARGLVSRFVEDYQTLYGLRHMLFNVHLLNHLVDSSKNWGPLWCFSALPFESLNKKITDSIKSPHHRGDQIITRFFIKKFITVVAKQIEISEITRQEIYRLLKIKNHHVEGRPECNYFLGIGRPGVLLPDLEEINCVREAGFIINPERYIRSYKKAEIHGTEYRVKDNVQRKFCNYIVFCKKSRLCDRTRFYIIEKLISYNYHDETISGFIGKRLQSIEAAYGTTHMQFVVEVEEKEFVDFRNIISPAFIIPSEGHLAVVPVSNVWETD